MLSLKYLMYQILEEKPWVEAKCFSSKG